MTWSGEHEPSNPPLAMEIKNLSLVSPGMFVGAVVLNWIVIGTIISGVVYWGNWIGYVLAIPLIAGRQHALGVLAHEAVHYRALRTRWLNDLTSDVLCAFPLFGTSTSGYRIFHLRHHRHNGTALDPEIAAAQLDPAFKWPKRRRDAVKTLLLDCIGVHALSILQTAFIFSLWPRLLRLNKSRGKKFLGMPEEAGAILLAFDSEECRLRPLEVTSYFLFLGLTCLALTLLHVWFYFLMLWFLPFITMLVFLFRVRAVAEHGAVRNDGPFSDTRTVFRPHAWERLLLCPLNVNYHLEHHLFPSVPWYNLPRVHRLLLNDAAFAEQAHVTDRYIGVHNSVLTEVTRAHV